ncbi:hypothetical protein [Halalkalibacter nanhaiisediminis]|uniref:hypothetical protein n=1 Tax=Halalkalibacter nanhaiisediminis TaxID=688079 RepID=UPI00131522F1|nr:hypothetical protein [Halalkalibacter nanhaiisediminis]
MNHKKPPVFRLVPHIASDEEKERAEQVKQEILTFLLRKVMDNEKPNQSHD